MKQQLYQRPRWKKHPTSHLQMAMRQASNALTAEKNYPSLRRNMFNDMSASKAPNITPHTSQSQYSKYRLVPQNLDFPTLPPRAQISHPTPPAPSRSHTNWSYLPAQPSRTVTVDFPVGSVSVSGSISVSGSGCTLVVNSVRAGEAFMALRIVVQA